MQSKDEMRVAAPDRWLLAYLLALLVASLAYRAPTVTQLLVVIGIVGSLALVAPAARSRSWTLVHELDPVVIAVLAFSATGPILAVANPQRWDDALAAVDQQWFGTLSMAWRHALGRPDWLTDAASLAYVSWYFLPVAIAVALFVADDRAQLHRFARLAVATFVITWIGYFMVPARGPRVAPFDEDLLLGGGAISRTVRGALRLFERNRLDAFPSGHTALAVIYFAVGGRALPRWRVPLAVAAVGIVFATVYLSLHYIVDVIAGVAVALAVLVLDGLGERRRARSRASTATALAATDSAIV